MMIVMHHDHRPLALRRWAPAVLIAAVALATAACSSKTPGHIVALDLATGEELWRVGGQPVFIHQAMVQDGWLFVGGGDGCTEDSVAAYDTATGQRLWREKLKGDCRANANMMALVPDERLIVLPNRGGATLDMATGERIGSRPELSSPVAEVVSGRWLIAGTLFVDPAWDSEDGDRQISFNAIDPQTRELKWRADLGVGSYGYPVTSDGETILFELVESYVNEDNFVITASSTLVGIDAATGWELWRDRRPGQHRVANQSGAPPLPYVQRGLLKEWLEVIDPRSGAVLWRTNETGRPIGVAAAGEVTIVTIDGKARAYDTASGRQLWESDPPQEHFSEAYPVIADGVVYIAIEGATHAFW